MTSHHWLGLESLDVVFQVVLVSSQITTSTASIGYDNEARVIIYLDVDKRMLSILVIFLYHKGGSVQVRASEVLRDTY